MAISPIEGDTSSRHRLSTAIETIRTAATPNQPTRDALLAAIVETQQRYGMVGDGGDGFPPRKGFLEALAGGGTPGRRWKLVYVCGKESVVAARKRWRRVGGSATDPSDSTTERRSAWDPNRFGLLRWFPPVLRYGQYVDGFVTAVQRFDMETFENENGILAVGGSEFVGFTVVGPFKWPKCDEGRQVCAFRPTEVRVRVGSEWSWSTLLSGGDETVPFSDAKVTELPFFRFILVDDRVAVAQGRSGSVALWTRM